MAVFAASFQTALTRKVSSRESTLLADLFAEVEGSYAFGFTDCPSTRILKGEVHKCGRKPQ